MATRLDIKKNIIEWAIARAGYEMQDYLMNNPMVKEWLDNSKKPTIKQLEKFSNNVHVPFGYMFLEEPPQEELKFPFFRTQKGKTNKVSLNVYHAIQIVQKRQTWLTEYLINQGYDQLPFVGKFGVASDLTEIILDIRRTLDLEIDWASKHRNLESALNHLSLHIEEAGIMMNFSGVVGNNNRRKIKVEECRGFVIVDAYAPFMFINSSDAKAAQMFTIIHELAHIWLGESAGFDFKNMLPASDPVETLCDQIAAEFLVPKAYFLSQWQKEQNFKELNKIFKVSPIVIARRALDLGLIKQPYFFKFYNDYINDFRFKKENQGGGGNFYATTKKRVSLRFASYINNAVKENKLLYKDAYRLTGLKGETYNKFIQEHLY